MSTATPQSRIDTAGSPEMPDRAAPRVLEASRLDAGYGARRIVHGVDLTIPTGKITVIIGANACGKSTTLKTLARVLAPLGGRVMLDGTDLSAMPSRGLARSLGLLPQQPIAPEGIAVADLVERGRHPHLGLLRPASARDRRIVEEALVATRTADLADRPVDELSGGQRQRVWIAMALAQRTDVLLLDEPTTFLDLANQIEVLDLLKDLNDARGTTIAIVLHDINLAARYADHVIAMKDGRIVASGAPARIIDADLIREVFGLESRVIADPVSGTPLVVPMGRHHGAGGAGAAGYAAAMPGAEEGRRQAPRAHPALRLLPCFGRLDPRHHPAYAPIHLHGRGPGPLGRPGLGSAHQARPARARRRLCTPVHRPGLVRGPPRPGPRAAVRHPHVHHQGGAARPRGRRIGRRHGPPRGQWPGVEVDRIRRGG